jgi:PPOX class probable F420-dependent enzyme
MAFQPDGKLLSRLAEPLAWLTTVTPTNRPAPRPIWFLYDGEAIVVFSQADAAKIKHVRANPNVTLHFNTDADGGNVHVITGTAEIVDGISPSTLPGYLDKYESMYERAGYTVASFDETFSLGIRITPERHWGF